MLVKELSHVAVGTSSSSPPSLVSTPSYTRAPFRGPDFWTLSIHPRGTQRGRREALVIDNQDEFTLKQWRLISRSHWRTMLKLEWLPDSRAPRIARDRDEWPRPRRGLKIRSWKRIPTDTERYIARCNNVDRFAFTGSVVNRGASRLLATDCRRSQLRGPMKLQRENAELRSREPNHIAIINASRHIAVCLSFSRTENRLSKVSSFARRRPLLSRRDAFARWNADGGVSEETRPRESARRL